MNSKFVFSEEEWNTIKAEYPLGREFETRIVKKIAPSLLVLDLGHQKQALLSLANLGWNLPQSEAIFKQLKPNASINVQVVNYFETSRTLVLSHKELIKKASHQEKWMQVNLGEKIKGEIVEIFSSHALVNITPELYGILSLSETEGSLLSVGDEKEFLVIGKSKKSNLFKLRSLHKTEESLSEKALRLKEADSFVDFTAIDHELESWLSFKKSNLKSLASKNDNQFLKAAFKIDSGLFSRVINLHHPLCISFKLNDNNWVNYFKIQYLSNLNEGVDEKQALLDLQNRTYWCKLTYSRDEQLELILFDDDILISVVSSDDDEQLKFVITSFVFGNKHDWAGRKKSWCQQNGCFLLQSKIRIMSPYDYYPLDDSQKRNATLLQNKFRAFNLYQKLTKEQGAILKEEGLALRIFDKFLEYQADKVRRENELNELPVKADQFKQVFDNLNPGNCLEIDESFVGIQNISDEDETHVNILIKIDAKTSRKNKDRENVGFAKYQQKSNRIQLSIKGDIDLNLLKDGFNLLPTVSTRQFNVQREIIKEFFSKQLKLQHIENLLINPEKIKAPLRDYFEFNNDRLRETEKNSPENNQIAAVRKAVGNSNVFLIQGPPGTGKTTVIAEVVQQLVNKGEKVLVSSQTHIAVDNVLEKLSESDDLCLLRVGAHAKLSDKIARYHIQGWRRYYASDYEAYLSNNIKLLTIIIERTEDFFNQEGNSFNKELINPLVLTYNDKLQSSFRDMHHKFLQTIIRFERSSLPDFREILIDWQKNLNEEEGIGDALVYNSIDVAFGTCIGLKTDRQFAENAPKFDTVIIDEAGKANLSESFVPISMAKKVILVGDQKQLPPYIDGSLLDENEEGSFPKSYFGKDFVKEDIEHALKTSFFEFLVNKSETKEFPISNIEMLNYQHRMHPNIGQFVSDAFYEGKLKMGAATHLNKMELTPPFDKEIVFIDTSSSPEPYESKKDISVENKAEAICIAEHILPKLISAGVKEADLAIISPYKSQVSLIRNKVQKNKSLAASNFEISTLDSFQGMEFDIIIFSFTRSASPKQCNKKVGFLDDARRLNVAFSRAKKKLILVGNTKTLTDPRSHYDYLFNYTNLFRKLEELSKNKKIGSFVELADFADLNTPFKEFCKQYQLGDEISVPYKSSTSYGHFFSLVENFDGMIFDPKQKHKFKKGQMYDLIISDISSNQKKIKLAIVGSFEANAVVFKRFAAENKKGAPVKVTHKISIKSGHIFTLSNGLDAFLHDPVKIKSFDLGNEYELLIDRIQVEGRKISLKDVEPKLNIKRGEILWATYTKRINQGFLFEYNGNSIIVNSSIKNKILVNGGIQPVRIAIVKGKLYGCIVEVGDKLKGRFIKKSGNELIFKSYGTVLKMDRKGTLRFDRNNLHALEIKMVDTETKELTVEIA